MIAREQPVQAFVQKTDVIGCMPGCMHGFEREFSGPEHIAVFDLPVRPERVVLMRALGRGHPESFRAGLVRKHRCGRRMVRVCVGDEDPANVSCGLRKNIVDVLRHRRPRVEHGDLRFPEQVGIRSRPRHHGWVRCRNPAHTGREFYRLTHRVPVCRSPRMTSGATAHRR